MQSRLATIATRSLWVLSAAQKQQGLQRNFVATASTGRTADPAIYSGDVEAGPDVHPGEPHDAKKVTESEPVSHQTATEDKLNNDEETEPLVRPKPPHITSPRLESTGLNQPLNPHFQQKRQKTTTTTTTSSAAALEEVSCAGLDGTPLPAAKENEQSDNKEEVEDDKEYFKHHKASPLSEIEMADTRKPITRATDGTADSGSYYGGVRDAAGWRPEQLDTAEEALLRATEIWRQNAMRGDPDTFPHSRVLRELRGEWF
ncbi:hypothetical protein ACOSP7_000489 [Xanthoceras sorbifolium]